jgi:hypothetical protein
MFEKEAEELAKQVVDESIPIKKAIQDAWWDGYAEGVKAALWGRGVAEEMVQEEERSRHR